MLGGRGYYEVSGVPTQGSSEDRPRISNRQIDDPTRVVALLSTLNEREGSEQREPKDLFGFVPACAVLIAEPQDWRPALIFLIAKFRN
jgi:hypothetical protein